MPSGSDEPSGSSHDGTPVTNPQASSNEVPNQVTPQTSQNSVSSIPVQLPTLAFGPNVRGPPPPPPRSPQEPLGALRDGTLAPTNVQLIPDSNNNDQRRACCKNWKKKYVLLCGTCGFSSLLLGTFYLIIYFVLRSYTSSLEFFQTIPTYIPAATLMVTGLGILLFVRRQYRTRLLIRLVGLLCLVSSVFCVIVTVSTTVLHMNRLQTLRECTFYTQLHSCTCLPFTNEEPFDLKLATHITTCDVIHGPLYSSLRAMFGVSVIGILVSIFSCMLVYQLLSHEKKKMYWEQLETRRRQLYRSSLGNPCPCDEYGFVPSNELYPWSVWDSMDESRYWNGTQMFSPNEESSNTSRSVLLGGAGTPSNAPSLWLPWGGAWGASNSRSHNPDGDLQINNDNNTQHDSQNSIANRPNSGVVLRPYLPRGYDPRIMYRRPPLGPPSSGRRPLSDPGVFPYPGYPPPFTEGFMPSMGIAGLDGFQRFIWDPPPPYSQPVSNEDIAAASNRPDPIVSSASEERSAERVAQRNQTNSTNQTQSRMGRFLQSPIRTLSPAKSQTSKSSQQKPLFKSVLLSNAAFKKSSLDHVKSLEDISQRKSNSLRGAIAGTHQKSLDRPNSQGDLRPSVFPSSKNNIVNDAKNVYSSGKSEQESELYFADVSSCMSVRQETDESLYYTEASNKQTNFRNTPPECHLYEEVGDKEAASTHTSDDTMVVHNSSSEHSVGTDAENAYSIVSPATDASSLSPMVTDTEAYAYAPMVSPVSPVTMQAQNVNQNLVKTAACVKTNNPNASGLRNHNMIRLEPYPKRSQQTCTSNVHSDMNGNPSLEMIGSRRANLSLPLHETCISPKHQKFTSENNHIVSSNSTPNIERCPNGKRHDTVRQLSLGETSATPRSEPTTPSRRLNSVQDLLQALKSVNV